MSTTDADRLVSTQQLQDLHGHLNQDLELMATAKAEVQAALKLGMPESVNIPQPLVPKPAPPTPAPPVPATPAPVAPPPVVTPAPVLSPQRPRISLIHHRQQQLPLYPHELENPPHPLPHPMLEVLERQLIEEQRNRQYVEACASQLAQERDHAEEKAAELARLVRERDTADDDLVQQRDHAEASVVELSDRLQVLLLLVYGRLRAAGCVLCSAPMMKAMPSCSSSGRISSWLNLRCPQQPVQYGCRWCGERCSWCAEKSWFCSVGYFGIKIGCTASQQPNAHAADAEQGASNKWYQWVVMWGCYLGTVVEANSYAGTAR